MSNESRMIRGMLMGAGLMYLLDPERGARRRGVLRDQAGQALRELQDGLDTGVRDLRNRARGVVAETVGRVRPESPGDEVVEARVRSALGRLVSHPRAIEARVDRGSVTLLGEVLAAELDPLLAGVEAVRGVKQVINDLEVHAEPGDVASLQGGHSREPGRMDILQSQWAPATRLLVGTLGGALALRGLRGHGVADTVLGLTGLGLLSRAATNLDAARLTGMEAGRRAVEVQKIATLNAPIDEVFAFWSNFENFPRFMSHLRQVTRTGAERSHWVAEVGGLQFAWDAELTGFEPEEVIAWRSIGDSPIRNAGRVRFQEEGPGRTRVDIRISYNPPAGAIGHAVATFFRMDPRSLMNDDLVRMRSLLEEGKTTAHHHSVHRDEIAVDEPRGS